MYNGIYCMQHPVRYESIAIVKLVEYNTTQSSKNHIMRRTEEKKLVNIVWPF